MSFRINFPEALVVYTGDCVPSSDLERLCEGVDLLICECSFPDGWETTDHMNARMVGELAEKARVKKLVVMHQYPPALKVDISSQIQRYYRGEIIVASDGKRISL